MSYADRQAERDASYTTAYREWVASLPPEERAALEAGGLCEPDATRHTSTRQHDEATLDRTAAPEPTPDDLAEQADESVPVSPSTSTDTTTAADVLASFCARIRAHPHPLLAFDAACFASGLMDIEGLSESALAKRHGVTRAAFSKLVIQWADLFGLKPSRGMRSKRARRAYRQARLTSLAQHHDQAAA
ncbi:hypothetical protein ASA1KI_23350 [Opitutales bacterium ASA1]|uniref:hypothetical protein n=1 Tax=Congregicoccus parvus TaxID=3081749 RepID=UPI002B2DB241|nr:hypothetical protein ASA1KI_23350 [Opitutales bacterium ASA1]